MFIVILFLYTIYANITNKKYSTILNLLLMLVIVGYIFEKDISIILIKFIGWFINKTINTNSAEAQGKNEEEKDDYNKCNYPKSSALSNKLPKDFTNDNKYSDYYKSETKKVNNDLKGTTKRFISTFTTNKFMNKNIGLYENIFKSTGSAVFDGGKEVVEKALEEKIEKIKEDLSDWNK